MTTPPDRIADLEQLETLLSEPSEALVEMFARHPGDVAVLGVGGKMGPSLAHLARRAADEAGTPRRILGVSRFHDAALPEWLQQRGIEPIACDLLDQRQVEALPDAPLVVLCSGMKFGTQGKQALTWATNCLIPAQVLARYPESRIAAFSTGNVYGLTSPDSGGARETDAPAPIGEYAMSCLGRERLIEHRSRTQGSPVSILRLNYACDLRYGVLVDLARSVRDQRPIDLTMGHFNTIWQGDANDMALRSLTLAATPPAILNLTGPETLSVREVAQAFARLMTREPRFERTEAPDALLSNAAAIIERLGRPRVGAETLLAWVADWVARRGPSLDKPTQFQQRHGTF